MQLGRISAEQTEQMPEKQCAGSQREKKQIRHLRRQPSRVIRCRFPNEPPRNIPNESEIFHLCKVYFVGHKYPLKSECLRE